MKLTPWFVDGEKPARPGVYNVSCRKEAQTGRYYGYWNGRFWVFGVAETPESAARLKQRVARGYVASNGSWRGLAEAPK